jgi:menaquinone-dependent protoporphyrinogen oxidase
MRLNPARECADILATRIKDSSVCDLSKGLPDIDAADMVIIGSGVRMGRVYKPFRKFVEKNLDTLLSKTTAVYLCNGEPGTYDQAVEKNIPAQLISHSLCVMSFGGKMPFRSAKNQDWVLMDNVNAFVQFVEQGESVQ